MQTQFRFVSVKEQAVTTQFARSSFGPVEYRFTDGLTLDGGYYYAAKAKREVRSHTGTVSTGQNGTEKEKALKNREPRGRCPSTTIQPTRQVVATEEERLATSPPRSVPNSSSVIITIDSEVARLPCVQLLLDNYLEHLAVAVPELDGPYDELLLRKTWFPMVIHSPVIFQVIVLFSASHYAARTENMALAPVILSIKQIAITGLMNALANSKGTFRDETIAAAAKMASYEAIYGCESVYHTHMKGVTEMVKARGGLSSLGLNGFLARLLHFIDTNAAFLLNCHVHLNEVLLPKLDNQFLPNPGQFIGAS